MKIKTFLALGGPLNGLQISLEQADGNQYHRYNSAESVQVTNKCFGCKKGLPRVRNPRGIFIHTAADGERFGCSCQHIGKPTAILIHASIWGEVTGCDPDVDIVPEELAL
jgi:hypothetical protein